MNPDMPFVEVTKVLGSEWSNMAPDEKQVKWIKKMCFYGSEKEI